MERTRAYVCMKHVLCARSSHPYYLVKPLPTTHKGSFHHSPDSGGLRDFPRDPTWESIPCHLPSLSTLSIHYPTSRRMVPRSLGASFLSRIPRGILPQIILWKVIKVKHQVELFFRKDENPTQTLFNNKGNIFFHVWEAQRQTFTRGLRTGVPTASSESPPKGPHRSSGWQLFPALHRGPGSLQLSSPELLAAAMVREILPYGSKPWDCGSWDWLSSLLSCLN